MWIEQAKRLWEPEGVYLNTASYRFRAGVGLEPGNSAIVVADLPGGAERLESAGIRAAVRGGLLRTSWHLYNTESDVDAALDALAG